MNRLTNRHKAQCRLILFIISIWVISSPTSFPSPYFFYELKSVIKFLGSHTNPIFLKFNMAIYTIFLIVFLVTLMNKKLKKKSLILICFCTSQIFKFFLNSLSNNNLDFAQHIVLDQFSINCYIKKKCHVNN